MGLDRVTQKFASQCPFAVLTQIALRALAKDDLNDLFEQHRVRQYEYQVSFADLTTSVADVVLGFSENFNQAYRRHKDELGVSCASFYEKLSNTELPVSEAVVRHSADRAAELQDALDMPPWEGLPGYRVFSIDGNHLQESEKRLAPLRDIEDAPLPGTIVARSEHQRMLLDRAYLLDDAHAQESTTHKRIAADLESKDVIIGDRQQCVLAFLKDIDEAGAYFLIRQHGRFQGVLVDSRQLIGETDRGVVYEQEIRTDDSLDAQSMRRITIVLNRPTEKGDDEVHLLTNLPRFKATRLSDMYLLRWEEENAFYYLTTTLTCEAKSVGNPRAALLLFCIAMLAWNVRQVLYAALFAVHPQQEVEELSQFHISKEISNYTDGMLIAVDESYWEGFVDATPATVAREMRKLAKPIDLSQYRKSVRGPKKKKPPAKKLNRKRTHASTAKLLREQK